MSEPRRPERVSAIGEEQHRRLAIDLFNFVWTLLEKSERTTAEDDTMLHAAHASRFHWGEIGQPVNAARGEWQVSRVYAVLGRAEPALHHARRCLEICEASEVEEWDIPYAYEALARAHAVAGDRDEARRLKQKARQAGERIEDVDDREHLLKDLATIP